MLKDYFADASTSLNVKIVTYYVWFHITLHFMRIKRIVRKGVILKGADSCQQDSMKVCGYLSFFYLY